MFRSWIALASTKQHVGRYTRIWSLHSVVWLVWKHPLPRQDLALAGVHQPTNRRSIFARTHAKKKSTVGKCPTRESDALDGRVVFASRLPEERFPLLEGGPPTTLVRRGASASRPRRFRARRLTVSARESLSVPTTDKGYAQQSQISCLEISAPVPGNRRHEREGDIISKNFTPRIPLPPVCPSRLDTLLAGSTPGRAKLTSSTHTVVVGRGPATPPSCCCVSSRHELGCFFPIGPHAAS
jgi:hypothetical protein